MPTLLHISDLHRTTNPRLSNRDLLSAIASDSKRWDEEGLPRPDIIVVSGDIIHGADDGSSDPDSEIISQYTEASEFLDCLATEFVNSDRSRVVIVPGNHDVQWDRARRAMSRIENCPPRISKRAYEANSRLRWDWAQQQAYQITDPELYLSRFEHYKKFRSDFYAGLTPSPIPRSDSDLVFIEYPSLGIAVAGFASWHGNDCFCQVGEIDSTSLASAQELLSTSCAPIAIAVWHHSIVGGPRVHDYMDQRVIHRLIDFGFSVGLHGHQHYPGAAPFELLMPNRTSMVVVGAGSFAVGNRELPMGEGRQFNIIVLDQDNKSITIHVRAMSSAGVFSGSHRNDFGGNTFVKLNLPHAPSRPKVPTATRRLDEAMEALASGDHERALRLTENVDSIHKRQKREITVRALNALRRNDELIDFLHSPQNPDELVRCVTLLLDAHRFDEAQARLEVASKLIDSNLYNDLFNTIAAARITS